MMDQDLSRSEQVLLWELFASGGAKLLRDIVPAPKGAHTALAGRKFIKATPRGRTRLLELEDRGWRWIADSDPFPIAADEKRVTAERRLLQSLTRGIKRYAAENGRTIQELFRVRPDSESEPRTESPPKTKHRVAPAIDEPTSSVVRDLENAIREAFFDLAGRPPRDSVRLSALRAKLPHVGRTELDRTLIDMRDARQVKLTNLDNPRDIARERDAELRFGHQHFHLLWIDA